MQNEKIFINSEKKEVINELPTVDYDNYSMICNYKNESSRLRGVLSTEIYKDIIDSPDTGFIIINGCRVPALIDARFGLSMGYDEARCRELSRDLSDNIKILSLPASELDEDEREQLSSLLANENCALFFSDHDGDESESLTNILAMSGLLYDEKPLIDERAHEGDKQAALYLYSCLAVQDSESNQKKVSLRGVADYYKENIGPSVTDDGKATTVIEMGDKITDQQAEEMWQIYNNRFDFLGEGHPISMQDSKDDFLDLLRSSNTLVSSTLEKDDNGHDRLTCFTYFIDDIEELYWLNQDYLKKAFSNVNKENYITNVFTPGLVSVGTNRMYSFMSIGLFSEACNDSGASINMMYENTNLSKRYVPRIVDGTIRRSCPNMVAQPSRNIDEVKYRLWNIKASN